MTTEVQYVDSVMVDGGIIVVAVVHPHPSTVSVAMIHDDSAPDGQLFTVDVEGLDELIEVLCEARTIVSSER